jgi:hypothetical protein
MSTISFNQAGMAYSITTTILSPDGDLTAKISISCNDETGRLIQLKEFKILWSEFFTDLEQEMIENDPHQAPLHERFSPQELTSMWFAYVRQVRAKSADFLDRCLEDNVVSVAHIPGQPKPTSRDLDALSKMFSSNHSEN